VSGNGTAASRTIQRLSAAGEFDGFGLANDDFFHGSAPLWEANLIRFSILGYALSVDIWASYPVKGMSATGKLDGFGLADSDLFHRSAPL